MVYGLMVAEGEGWVGVLGRDPNAALRQAAEAESAAAVLPEFGRSIHVLLASGILVWV